jgi:hypothetical protein
MYRRGKTFVQLDSTTDSLESQKRDLLSFIEARKRTLKAEWEAKFEAEKDRRAFRIIHSSAGAERREARLAVLKEIGDVGQWQKSEEEKPRGFLDELTRENSISADQIRLKLCEAKSTEESDRLRSELDELRSIGGRGIERTRQMSLQEAVEFRSLLVKECAIANEQLWALAGCADRENANFEARKRELEQQLAASQSEFRANLAEISNDVRTIEGLSESHSMQMAQIAQEQDDVKKEIAMNASSFRKRLKASRSQHHSAVDESERRWAPELEEGDQDAVELRRFYDERLVVLRKKSSLAGLMLQTGPFRPAEIRIPDHLQGLLKTKMLQLQNAIKDLQEYGALPEQQQTDTAWRFGKTPAWASFGRR